MFDFVRKHTRVMQLLLFILIVPSFVLFGLEGYNRMSERGDVVAEVDGRAIHQQEWDNAHRAEVDRVRQQMPNLDAQLLDSPQARYETLERMVRDRVLAAAANDLHLTVSDARLASELQRNPLIASLRKPDGTLDAERYRQLLASQGMTPEAFENQMRRDMAVQQVLGGVAGSAFTPAAQAGVALGSYFERREVQVARFAPADYAAKVQPTDAELEAFYKDHPQRFQSPEQATIEYVVLDAEAAAKGVTVNEQDLRAYYEQNAARLSGGQEERRVSHILIAAPKDAPPAERQKARARAEELLAEAKKNPAAFAELAKKNSQDPGSAARGGDLDFFTRGAMTKPFEDAAFAMTRKGELSGVVETDFGYHILLLTDLKQPVRRTFEEVRPQLEAELRQQQAQRRYAELAETLSNTVYEQPDSLKPAAEKLGLEIRTATGVGRTPAPGATGPLANAKFLGALFTPDALERKRNTEALEVGPNQMVSGRIVQYQPASTRPFAEVKAQVREQLVATRAAELAKKEGEQKLAAWKQAPASAAVGAPVVVSRQQPGQVAPAVVDTALRADPTALPAFLGVDQGAEGYAVVKVNKVLPRETPSAEQARMEIDQLNRAWASAEAQAYYELLKDRFKVKIEVPKPAPAAAR